MTERARYCLRPNQLAHSGDLMPRYGVIPDFQFEESRLIGPVHFGSHTPERT